MSYGLSVRDEEDSVGVTHLALVVTEPFERRWPCFHLAALAVDCLHGTALIDGVEPVTAATLPVATDDSGTAWAELVKPLLNVSHGRGSCLGSCPFSHPCRGSPWCLGKSTAAAAAG